MKLLKSTIALLMASLTVFATTQHVDAAVPLRISVKFILDASDNRPATGNLNTDAEILGEIDEAISILASTFTEFEVDTIQFLDLSGVSQWYSASATVANRDNLKAAAIASPTTYQWRTDAINIYINGGTSSAIGSFPPNNEIILMNQFCGNTPSCVLHEIGHNVNLLHTHQGGGADGCSDTILDNQAWTKDQMSINNYGVTYANLTAAQRNSVDITYNNVMSYHVDEPQRRLSNCQKDRISAQGSADVSWLLTKAPIYVDESGPGFIQLGTWAWPYIQLQNALNAGGLDNRVLVLEQSTHTITQQTINANVEMVTRTGPSTVDRGVQKYQLPLDLHKSNNSQVQAAVEIVRSEDTKARKVMKEARELANSSNKQVADNIMATAKAQQKLHKDNALSQLVAAEKVAAGDEKIAIQLELAQRYRYAGDFKNAAKYYKIVADTTDQPGLQEEASMLNKQFQKKHDSKKPKGSSEEMPIPEDKRINRVDNSGERQQ